MLPFTSVLSIAATFIAYTCFRLKGLIDVYRHTAKNPNSCINSVLYLIVEVGLLLPNLLDHLLRCLALGENDSQVRHLRLTGNDNLPNVDVFITCAGEDVGTIMSTVKGACALDYPVDKFRVLVFDDAGSDELSHQVEDLRSFRAKNLLYTSREKGPDHHFKAGNLNYAHGYVEGLPGGPAPFIAALDADMIPSPEWLRALLPHITKDEKLALVQPPQVRNLPVCYYRCYILFHPHQRAAQMAAVSGHGL